MIALSRNQREPSVLLMEHMNIEDDISIEYIKNVISDRTIEKTGR